MTSDRQALSDRHKEAVKSWVPRVRKVLEQDFAAQLERLGMKPSGKHTPLDKMKLPDEAKAIRWHAEALLSREVIAEGSAKRGFDNVLRELTYTLLNRLVGLKAMEMRKLLFLPPPANPELSIRVSSAWVPGAGEAASLHTRRMAAIREDRPASTYRPQGTPTSRASSVCCRC